MHGSVVLLKYYPSSAASAIAAAAIVASHVGSVIAKVVWGVMAAGQWATALQHIEPLALSVTRKGRRGQRRGTVKDSMSELAGGTAKTGQEDCAQGTA